MSLSFILTALCSASFRLHLSEPQRALFFHLCVLKAGIALFIMKIDLVSMTGVGKYKHAPTNTRTDYNSFETEQQVDKDGILFWSNCSQWFFEKTIQQVFSSLQTRYQKYLRATVTLTVSDSIKSNISCGFV